MLCVTNEPVTMRHRRNDPILPPSQYVRYRTGYDTSRLVNRATVPSKATLPIVEGALKDALPIVEGALKDAVPIIGNAMKVTLPIIRGASIIPGASCSAVTCYEPEQEEIPVNVAVRGTMSMPTA